MAPPGGRRKAPDPTTVLRGHRKSVQCVAFYGAGGEEGGDAALLLSGDQEGRLRAWDLGRRRATYEGALYPEDSGFVAMRACEGEGWAGKLLTQGREGCVKCWDVERLLLSAEDESAPEPLSSFSTGCYNFCRFSAATERNLVSIPGSDTAAAEVWDARRSERVSVVGAPESSQGNIGMCMCLCLKSPSVGSDAVLLWVGYESGAVACFDLRHARAPLVLGNLGGGEPLMTLDVDKTGLRGVAATVGSEIFQFKSSAASGSAKEEDEEPGGVAVQATYELREPGVSEVLIRSDGKLFASAGWDGKVRIYDYKKRAPLAVLKVSEAPPSSSDGSGLARR